jgi:hypothetical protein
MKVRIVGVRRVWDCILCTYVSEEGGDGEDTVSETPSLFSYTLRYVSLAELVTLCRVGLRDPMHLCTCVSEEGGDGEDAGCYLCFHTHIECKIFFLFFKKY